jgi:hypothetical protein
MPTKLENSVVPSNATDVINFLMICLYVNKIHCHIYQAVALKVCKVECHRRTNTTTALFREPKAREDLQLEYQHDHYIMIFLQLSPGQNSISYIRHPHSQHTTTILDSSSQTHPSSNFTHFINRHPDPSASPNQHEKVKVAMLLV